MRLMPPLPADLPLRIVMLLAALLVAALPARAQFNGEHAISRHNLADENFFDWRAYQPLQPARYAALAAPNLLNASAGSLSQERFFSFHEIRLQKDLGHALRFAFEQQQNAFFRNEPVAQEVELAWGAPAALGVVGFPQAEKAFGNQGFSLQWGRRTAAMTGGGPWVRYTHMAQYSLYNDKTDSGYRYDPTPDFDRVEVLAFPGQRLLLRALVVRERPTLRVADSTATTGEESYEGARGELTLDWWLSDTWMAGLSTRQLREERAYSPTGEDDATAAQSQVLALRHTDVYTVLYLPGGDVLEAGLWGGRFANSIAALDDRQDYRHSLDSTAAYAFWQWFRSERLHWLFSLQAGEMQLYERRGEAPEKTKDERTPQVKLGAGLVLAQPGDYRFVFNSTWDLDILTDRAWDGGNIQVQLFF